MRKGTTKEMSRNSGLPNVRPCARDSASRPNHRLKPLASSMIESGLLVSSLMAGQLLLAPISYGAPQGGVVVAGEGTLTRINNLNTKIAQDSQNLLMNFDSFDLNVDESVLITQPNAAAWFVGRIVGGSPTAIFGSITANGQIALVNPRGVVFGETARVDAASLFATSLELNAEAFDSGKVSFKADSGPQGMVLNQGVIHASTGGSVTLLGEAVSNEGAIVANLGHVNLVSGREAVVSFGPEKLIGVQVTKEVLENSQGLRAAVENSGRIEAAGGQVILTGEVSRNLFDHAVNNSGIVRAKRAEHKAGVIRLFGSGGGVLNTGTLNTVSEVSGEPAGSIELISDESTVVSENSLIIADSEKGEGGSITVLGERISLLDDTALSASGGEGGGEINIGAPEDIGSALPAADRVFVGSDVSLNADATASGDGGHIVVTANTAVQFSGSVSAVGGSISGDGGTIEISAQNSLSYDGVADASAVSGEAGTLLLKSSNIIIDDSNIDLTDVAGFMNATVDAGRISAGALEKMSAGTDLNVNASESITINNLSENALKLPQQTDGSVIFAVEGVSEGVDAGSAIQFALLGADDLITTDGGSVAVTASDLGANANALIEIAGTIEVDPPSTPLPDEPQNPGDVALLANNGRIRITETGVLRNRGVGIDAADSSDGVPGGNILLSAAGWDGVNDAGTIYMSGELDASSETGNGGMIKVLGDRVAVMDSGFVNASGRTGGGEILLGGNYQGLGEEATAQRTYVGADVQISADAISSGDGGRVIVWADDITRFYGNISAEGGADSGDGGFVETSSKRVLESFGGVSVKAVHGQSGSWLIDPSDITIDSSDLNISDSSPFQSTSSDMSVVSVSTIIDSLTGGASVLIDTSVGVSTDQAAGNITLATPLDYNGTGHGSLILNADNDINIGAPIFDSGVGSDSLNVGLNAYGNVNVYASIETNGGSFASTGNNFVNLAGIHAGTGSVTLNHHGGAVSIAAGIAGGEVAIGAGSVSVSAFSSISAGGSVDIWSGSDLVVSSDISSSVGNVALAWGQSGFGGSFILNAPVTAAGGMATARGGPSNDSYVLNSGGSISGAVAGGGGIDSARGSAIVSNGDEGLLEGFSSVAIRTYNCGGGTCTLRDAQPASGGGVYTGIYNYTGYNATYILEASFSVDDMGGAGTLIGLSGPDFIEVTGNRSGSANGVYFTGIGFIDGGEGNDVFNLGKNSSLNSFFEGITFSGGEGLDSLTFDDANGMGSVFYALSDSTLDRTGMGQVKFDGMESLALNAANVGANINLSGASSIDLAINAGQGIDQLNINDSVIVPGTLSIGGAESISQSAGVIVADSLLIDGVTSQLGQSTGSIQIDVNSLSVTNSNASAHIIEANSINLETIDVGSGSLELQASQDILIGDISAASGVALVSTGGSIGESGAGDLEVDIAAESGAISLTALNSIGGAGDSGLDVSTTELEAHTTAVGGDITIESLGSAELVLQDVATVAGNISVTSSGAMTSVDVSTAGGSVSLMSGSTLNAQYVAATDGNIDLKSMGSMTVTDATAIDSTGVGIYSVIIGSANEGVVLDHVAADGEIIASAAGDIEIGEISAVLDVTLTSIEGSIRESSAADAAADITSLSGSIGLSALGEIGNSGNGADLEIDGARLTAHTYGVNGNIVIEGTNSNALTLADIGAVSGDIHVSTIGELDAISVDAANGDISLQSGQALQAIHVEATNGNISLGASGYLTALSVHAQDSGTTGDYSVTLQSDAAGMELVSVSADHEVGASAAGDILLDHISALSDVTLTSINGSIDEIGSGDASVDISAAQGVITLGAFGTIGSEENNSGLEIDSRVLIAHTSGVGGNIVIDSLTNNTLVVQDVDASTGNISINAEGAVEAVAVDTTSAGDISLVAGAAMDAVHVVANDGTLSLSAAGQLVVSDVQANDSGMTGEYDVVLASSAADLILTSATADNALTASAAGGISLDSVTAGGDVSLTSVDGAIDEIGVGDSDVDIESGNGTISLNARHEIGSLINDSGLEIKAPTLVAQTTGADGNILIDSLGETPLVLEDVDVVSGTIAVTADSALTAVAVGATSSGDIRLDAAGALNGESVAAGNGSIELKASSIGTSGSPLQVAVGASGTVDLQTTGNELEGGIFITSSAALQIGSIATADTAENTISISTTGGNSLSLGDGDSSFTNLGKVDLDILTVGGTGGTVSFNKSLVAGSINVEAADGVAIGEGVELATSSRTTGGTGSGSIHITTISGGGLAGSGTIRSGNSSNADTGSGSATSGSVFVEVFGQISDSLTIATGSATDSSGNNDRTTVGSITLRADSIGRTGSDVTISTGIASGGSTNSSGNLNVSTDGGDANLSSTGSTTLGNSNISGNLNLTSVNTINQDDSATLTVSGNSSFETTGTDQSITLDNDNRLAGEIGFDTVTSGETNAGHVSLKNTLDTTLSESLISGNLSVQVIDGFLRDSGVLTVLGKVSFVTTDGDILLDTIDAAGELSVATGAGISNGDVAITNRNSAGTTLAASDVSGNLSIQSTNAISQTGALTVAGTSAFETTGGDGQSIDLSHADNALKGTISVATSGLSNTADVMISNSLATSLNTNNVAGMDASVSGDLTIDVTGGTLSLGKTTLAGSQTGGTLTATSTGNISQTDVISADVLTASTHNDEGASITLNEENAVGTLNLSTFNATGEDLVSGAIEYRDVDDILIGQVGTADSVTIYSGARILSSGDESSITADSLTLTADSIATETDQLNVSVSTLETDTSAANGHQFIKASDGIMIAGMDSGEGDITLSAEGDITSDGSTIAANNLTISTSGNDSSIGAIGDGAINVSLLGELTARASQGAGSIFFSSGDVLSIATATAGTGDVEIHSTGTIKVTDSGDGISAANILLSASGWDGTNDAGTVYVSGLLDVSSDDEMGGTIKVLGDRVALLDGAYADASGATGGGEVLIGGNFQGRGPEQNASRTFVGSGAYILADAINEGNGGRIIVWGDDRAHFGGSASATGGAQSGNGGFVEISSPLNLSYKGTVDLSAAYGELGTLLFDPYSVEIIGGGPTDGTYDTDTTDTTLGTFVGDPTSTSTFSIYESEIEGTAGNIILAATKAIFTSGTFTTGINLDLNQDLSLTVNHSSTDTGIVLGVGITTSGTGSISLTTSGTGTAAITTAGLTAGTGGITINSTGAVNVNSALTTTGANNLAGGAIAVTASGAITTGAINALGGADTDGVTSTGNAGGNVTLNAGTTLSVGAIDTSSSDADASSTGTVGSAGTIDLDGATSVTLTGNLTATGGDAVAGGTSGAGSQISFNDAVILNATGQTITLDTRGGTAATAGNDGGVLFDTGSTLNATTAFDENLTISGGAITFTGAVGDSKALGNVILTDSSDVSLDNATFAVESLTATSNITTFDSTAATLTTTGGANTAGGSIAVTSSGAIIRLGRR
jgi:filamentous hemagglutinin family protein